MSREFPWPRKGDRLFTRDRGSRNAAYLAWEKGWNAVHVYAKGYRKAAKVLTQYVIEADRDHNFLIYPIVFLWRHYTELRLKSLLRISRHLSDEDPTIRLQHGLDYYWKNFRKLVEEPGFPPIDKNELDAVEVIILELQDADPSSFAFRYPIDSMGRPSQPGIGNYIDIDNLSEVMERVANFLDAAEDYLDYYLEIKRGIERDYLP